LQIFLQFGLGPRLLLFQFGLAPVLIGGVAGLDPDAVNGQQLAAKQIQLPAQAGEFARDGLEGGGVVLAEVGNGFEVGLQLAQQPEDFQVAPAPG
jgi:hypothetical protein